jgi:hypothetical protein
MGSSIKSLISIALLAITVVLLYMGLNRHSDDIKPAQVTTEHTVGEFTNLVPFTLGRISLLGSIADTDVERALGLSNTKEIPIGVAKVFIFDTSAKWSFWMKDMNYPIDIFWLDENGQVVHVVENAAPDTYPETSFVPPVPARYVIETKAGFAKENSIGVGAVAGMTQILKNR